MIAFGLISRTWVFGRKSGAGRLVVWVVPTGIRQGGCDRERNGRHVWTLSWCPAILGVGSPRSLT
jgi:hypothetical protein